jgi:hypothetical protein
MNMNKSKLEFIYSQIIAKYINERSDFKHFIQTCHKNKDAALSLKTNSFPMIIGDEIRFPNIETQIIYTDYDIPLIYTNRKIKYIKPKKTFVGLDCPLKIYDPNIISDNKNIKLNYEKFKNHNIHLYYGLYNNISTTISDGFDSLTKLVLDNSRYNKIYTYNMNINLPSLKCLSIINFDKANFILFTPNLICLNVKYFESMKIKEHNLLMINTSENKRIMCNFNYPFYYNGIKCNDLTQYIKIIKDNIIYNNRNLNKLDLSEYLIFNDNIKDEIDFMNAIKILCSLETVPIIYNNINYKYNYKYN